MAGVGGTVVGAAIGFDLDDPAAPHRAVVVADQEHAQQAARRDGRRTGQEKRQVAPGAGSPIPGRLVRARQPKRSRSPAGVIQANTARKAGISVPRNRIAVCDGS